MVFKFEMRFYFIVKRLVFFVISFLFIHFRVVRSINSPTRIILEQFFDKDNVNFRRRDLHHRPVIGKQRNSVGRFLKKLDEKLAQISIAIQVANRETGNEIQVTRLQSQANGAVRNKSDSLVNIIQPIIRTDNIVEIPIMVQFHIIYMQQRERIFENTFGHKNE